jgi:hypothetical protein
MHIKLLQSLIILNLSRISTEDSHVCSWTNYISLFLLRLLLRCEKGIRS